MLSEIVGFLAMLNPFALFLYLQPVMSHVSSKDFLKVLLRASLISFVVFVVFMVAGDFIFRRIFQINFEAFRIFGGIVIFSFAYYFIVKGQKAFIQIKEDLRDTASDIALPFMVGAGTISLSIIMADDIGLPLSIPAVFFTLVINYGSIAGLKYLRENITHYKVKVAFDKNMEILIRINGFFLGAIGVNTIIRGVQNVFGF